MLLIYFIQLFNSLNNYNLNTILLYFIILCLFISNLISIFKYRKLVSKYRHENNLRFELNKIIKEKKILLKEIHHRVKNNLQIIVSLLHIQSRISKNTQIDLFIQKCEARIKSMLLIHEMLCVSDDVSRIDFKAYVHNLIHNIYEAFDINHVDCIVQMDDIFEFDIETAIPLGLIINEIINNSFKYGFPTSKKGEIVIKLIKINDKLYKLTVLDNGVGFDVDCQKLGSIGLDIVRVLVDQMSGKFKIESNSRGVECTILFSEI